MAENKGTDGGGVTPECDGIVIEQLGGNCPVQAEGTIDGKRFYFRARGSHWSIDVHPTATGIYEQWPSEPREWEHWEKWGDGPYDAGWMPEGTAREMIAKGADIWRRSLTHGDKR